MSAAARRHWAEQMMRRATGTTVPTYGSPEWLALSEGDVRKVAAVVRAAESWAREGDDLEESLRVEVLQMQQAHKALEDAEYVARAQAHREEWRHLRVVRGAKDYAPEPPRDLYDIGAEHMANRDGGRPA
jgi:hypothetical protein